MSPAASSGGTYTNCWKNSNIEGVYESKMNLRNIYIYIYIYNIQRHIEIVFWAYSLLKVNDWMV